VLGDRILSVVWNMAYCHASLLAGIQVYVVVAGGASRDEAQTRKSLEHLLRDAGVDEDREHVAIGMFEHLFRHQGIVVEAEAKDRKSPSLQGLALPRLNLEESETASRLHREVASEK
jgi:hypothetical protein